MQQEQLKSKIMEEMAFQLKSKLQKEENSRIFNEQQQNKEILHGRVIQSFVENNMIIDRPQIKEILLQVVSTKVKSQIQEMEWKNHRNKELIFQMEYNQDIQLKNLESQILPPIQNDDTKQVQLIKDINSNFECILNHLQTKKNDIPLIKFDQYNQNDDEPKIAKVQINDNQKLSNTSSKLKSSNSLKKNESKNKFSDIAFSEVLNNQSTQQLTNQPYIHIEFDKPMILMANIESSILQKAMLKMELKRASKKTRDFQTTEPEKKLSFVQQNKTSPIKPTRNIEQNIQTSPLNQIPLFIDSVQEQKNQIQTENTNKEQLIPQYQEPVKVQNLKPNLKTKNSYKATTNFDENAFWNSIK